MTKEQIKQKAKEYLEQNFPTNHLWERKNEYDAFIAGAHNRDEEINHWKESYEELAEIANDLQSDNQKLMIENARLSNKWIKCSEQPPKKVDGRIRLNVVLVTLGQCWTAAEYHFGDKKWINMLGERETIEPEYWQDVNLPEQILDKGE
jgi:hypothetical protein